MLHSFLHRVSFRPLSHNRWMAVSLAPTRKCQQQQHLPVFQKLASMWTQLHESDQEEGEVEALTYKVVWLRAFVVPLGSLESEI